MDNTPVLNTPVPLSTTYRLAMYECIGWERTEESATVFMVKRPSRCRLVGRASFHRTGEGVVFRAQIKTPEGHSLEEIFRENPSCRDVQRVIFGVYESYLEGATNDKKIRRIFREYRV